VLEDCRAKAQLLRGALEAALAAFRDDQEMGIDAALDAVIDFLHMTVPVDLVEPLRVVAERLDDARPRGNQKGRGNRKSRTQATMEAQAAAQVDRLVNAKIEPTIAAACKRVVVERKDLFGGDWKQLRTLRNHLRKRDGQHEALDCYDYWIRKPCGYGSEVD